MKLIALLIAFTTTSALAGVCATAYQGDHFTGRSLIVMDHERMEALSDFPMTYSRSWDNKISSVVLESGCELTVYQYENMGVHYRTGHRIGDRHTYENHSCGRKHIQLRYLNNKVSSLKCYCN